MWISDLNKLSTDVGKKLLAKGQTIAVSESLTAGRLQAAIARVSGASRYFLGGVTVYSLEQKVRQLGVERKAALACNCVSERVAIEMARGTLLQFGADVAVSTTGYAETTDGSPPYAYYAIALNGQVVTGRVEAPASMERPDVQEYIANYVLAKLEANL